MMIGRRKKYLTVTLIVCLFVIYRLVHHRLGDEASRAAILSSEAVTSTFEWANNNNFAGFSILGQWLRSPEATPPPKRAKRNDSSPVLLILMWKYGPLIERRHIRHPNNRTSPWYDCSVKDCRLSYEDDDLSKADAVVFHLHMTTNVTEIPREKGKPGQIWIFMTDESPFHTFLRARGNSAKISTYDNLFDWSMTYRSDSDVPVAYGRAIERRIIDQVAPTSFISTKNKLVAILGSNCGSKNSRWKYVGELKKLLGDKFDIYGKCQGANHTACPGGFHHNCPILNHYKFYLAFENSNCREYMTEKIFWNAYEKKSVPIVMGASRDDCRRLLPPGSFIHVDDFRGPAEIADYLVHLDGNDAAYAAYHQWRSRWIVINEHGYFGSASKHYCRVCEALRYNVPPNRKYSRMGDFWNVTRDCRSGSFDSL